MLGFVNQVLGKCDHFFRDVDHAGHPILVFRLGKDRPVMHAIPIDDGRLWSQVSDMLINNDTACNIAAIRRPVGVD